MGLYSYFCKGCEKNFEVRHPYKERLEVCPYCSEKNPTKILNNPIKIINKRKSPDLSKAGTIVKDSIQSAKEDIKKEKTNYRKRVKK
mgnify:CR=1 FL=1